ncbi:hypothetical protein NS206_07365 [Microbacterium testaceum]|uniref:hypothetical protein n=1 Tax=Microbacterium testaceum TaxID=2033 RepID=UPI000734F89D|nr:hypothetical protein [Microbacterium testaceum]KTS64638.1 hypothetical protein NS206_07365 [Microbacterium testaceum]
MRLRGVASSDRGTERDRDHGDQTEDRRGETDGVAVAGLLDGDADPGDPEGSDAEDVGSEHGRRVGLGVGVAFGDQLGTLDGEEAVETEPTGVVRVVDEDDLTGTNLSGIEGPD